MDTFMDRLAQKFTAQEMIKANAAAEAEELNRLREQVQEYTECLDRMQQICADMERTSKEAKGRVDEARLDTDGLREQLLEIWKNVQDMQAKQQNSVGEQDDSSQRMLAEQLNSMRSAQDAQFENIRGLQADQIEDIRDMQARQLENIQGMQARQLEDIQGIQAQQLESIRGMQSAQVEAIKSSVEDQLDSMRSMVKAQVSGIKNVQDGQLDSLRGVLDAQNNTLSAKIGEMQANLETQLNGSNDFIHKECVKVYRNVQAVVGEENNKQSDNLEYLIKPMTGKMKNLFNIATAALVFSLISVVLQVLSLLHIF